MWSVQKRASSLSGGSLTLNLTWSVLGYWSWLQVSSEHAHPLIRTSIHHPLSTTHPHTLTEFTVQRTRSLSNGKLTSNLIIRGPVLSHSSALIPELTWPVASVLAVMCCHGATSVKELLSTVAVCTHRRYVVWPVLCCAGGAFYSCIPCVRVCHWSLNGPH